MAYFKNPYISRVVIKNFRNFLHVDVRLDHKQVVIGENNVGKTNFLRAIQLILDKDFSDSDRQLSEDDFHDSLIDPMINGAEIEIVLEVMGYEHNRKLVAQFADAVISLDPPILQFKYKYFPDRDDSGSIINYRYELYKGESDDRRFTSEDRSYINISVIKALRDVERELKANKRSPLYKLIKQYDISKSSLETISEELVKAADGILELDEIAHIRSELENRFVKLSGLQIDTDLTLRTFDIDTERLLYTMQVYMGLKERPVSELSLGLANILYVSLMLILLKDRTILPIIKMDKFTEWVVEDSLGILPRLYELSEKDNYVLKHDISEDDMDALYEFMNEHNFKPQSFTILAVEEPESHLHPILQRMIYRQVLHESNTSVIFTSHSSFIASVTPLNYIVHVRRFAGASTIYSTVDFSISTRERKDIERYIDAKRGEIYFGKGVILVEGITEEYIVPSVASLLNITLDDYGVVVCNIDSTNFSPYIGLLNKLNIPWVLLTDGDYYEVVKELDAKSSKEKDVRKYHIKSSGGEAHYKGIELMSGLLVELGAVDEGNIPSDLSQQRDLLRNYHCFVGEYTFEVDMMELCNDESVNMLKGIYSDLILGGEEMRENFNNAIDTRDFWTALKKIENNISKGRFAQRLANDINIEMVPDYIIAGINSIVQQVISNHE